MLRLPPEYYVKGAHPQCVDVSIRKITLVEDDSLETDVHSASSGMGAIARHEVLREPLVGVVPVLLRHSAMFSTVFVPYNPKCVMCVAYPVL
jgi:hypothetical protein